MARKNRGNTANTQPAQPVADGATPSEAPKPEAKKRVLLGDPSKGIRAHPSYDHADEGLFYAVEANSRHKVASGYHTVERIKEIAKELGVEFLGVVNVRGAGKGTKLYNKDVIASAGAEHGFYARKVAEKPEETASEENKETADVA